jgi:hypothetical protein
MDDPLRGAKTEAGIILGTPSDADGYFIPRHRLQGVVATLRGTPVGKALAYAIATREAKEE